MTRRIGAESGPLKTRYARDLDRLDATYERSLSSDYDNLLEAVTRIAGRPLIAIGSGGSQTSADSAARLHSHYSGQLALSFTPLEFLCSTFPRECTVLLLSARGRNADSLAALRAAERAEVDQIIVLTCNAGSPLVEAARGGGHSTIVEIETPVERDGYLATNTLLATMTTLQRSFRAAYDDADSYLPQTLRDLLHPEISRTEFLSGLRGAIEPLTDLEHLVTLFGGWASTSAIDIESRLTESALCGVQIADFRNFAHGRHQWLIRHAQTSGVLALVTPSVAQLARKTLDKIPDKVALAEVSTKLDGPLASIALVAQSLFITEVWSDAVGIDPARPKVPMWARRLYHMHPTVEEEEYLASPIRRKLGLPRRTNHDRLMQEKLRIAVERLDQAKVRAAVLNYDGTVVESYERNDVPRDEVAQELSRLLSEGMHIGFASGRGKSIRRALRKALPSERWNQVLIGYYNGTDIGLLSDSARPDGTPAAVDQELRQVLDLMSNNGMILSGIEERPHQLTLTPEHPTDLRHYWERVQSLIDRQGIPARTVLSSHSLDVLPASATKLNVVNRLAEMVSCHPDEVIRIGDMGAWPGNDFDLLDHHLGLSVRTPPAGLYTDGWNLAPPGETGTQALLRYLQAVRRNDEGVWGFQVIDSGLVVE